jgi:hypothetical protein
MKHARNLASAVIVFVLVATPSLAGAADCTLGGDPSGPCGAVPEGDEGCCTADDTSVYCENGILCVLDCSRNSDGTTACGWDAEIDAYNCLAPLGFADPTCAFPLMCPADCVPCGGIEDAGCCAGAVTTWCECGCLHTIDCSTNPAGSRTCGWDSEYDTYDCGQTGADPSGLFPLACTGTCTPDCAGKDCGPDGCGGVCGTCYGDDVCDDTGWCCWPNCSFNDCGDDGCGGSCGTCPGGETCDFGTCTTDGCVADCFGRQCGDDGCGGSCGNCAADQTCASVGVCFGGGCTGDCAGRACGDDGCGESCGQCTGTDVCDGNGTCVTGGGCVSNCVGLECGTDGCGGICGECLYGYSCQSGLCVATTPCTKQCAGKACGDDGCGGQCGTCPTGFACQGTECVDARPCEPLCVGRQCGPDGCAGACGVCVPPLKCSENGRCYDVTGCVPACNGRQCGGDDGCGASCGTCRSSQQCGLDGMCVDNPSPGADATAGADDGSGIPSCPAGTVPSYGSCVAGVVPQGAVSSGCSAGSAAPVTGPMMAALLALVAMAGARRRRP